MSVELLPLKLNRHHLTWRSAKARFAKSHRFHHNMVELRINVGVQGVPSMDAIIKSFQSLVQDLSGKGHLCQLVQVLRIISVDNALAFAHVAGDYSAFLHFDDDSLFKRPNTTLKEILPSRIGLPTRGIPVTALRHDYEKEAACGRCHFIGHVGTCGLDQERKRKEAHNGNGNTNANKNTITNDTNIVEAEAPIPVPVVNSIASQNRFAGLEVEEGQEEAVTGQSGQGPEESGEEDAGDKLDDEDSEDSEMESEATVKMEVIKLESEDESVLEDRGGSDGEVIDEDEVMADGRGETEGKVATEMEGEEVAMEVDDVDEAGGATKAENAEATDLGETNRLDNDDDSDATATAATASRESTPHEPTPPLSPETLAKSLREGEEWDRIRANWVEQARLERDQSIERRLDAEAPLVRHNFATWDKDGEIRSIYIRGTAAKEAGNEEVADCGGPQAFLILIFLTGAHKLQSFGLAGTATKRAKGGYKATTASSWVKVKPLCAKTVTSSTLDNLRCPLAPPAEIITYTRSKLTSLELQARFSPRSTPPVDKLSDISPTTLAACISDASQGNGGKRGGLEEGPRTEA
ncbi:BQ5605_C026g10215 [Microbotryum silenes-dioicae]|uniref:BQ5605_C026g10215 protein n=1 Tax=Microbotryum silenes-dioicae TaxID=796604 RepID=A0A2X0MRI3_9BASI|nr:BQ5605_C026g10215 [Microbotryum silenes-dioicae]